MKIMVQENDFNVEDEISALAAGDTGIGGIASFVGLVREENDGSAITGLTLEHYPAMTQKALEDIVAQAGARWPLRDAVVIHRVGALKPGARIVLVAVASAHRGDAFAACQFIMDYLKTQAPFWKKERTTSGERWVEARASDEEAARRWR